MYKIHGGPMAGRSNYQACSFQCIRPGELWQVNWLEGLLWMMCDEGQHNSELLQTETGTIVSFVVDLPKKKVTTLIAFAKGKGCKAEG